MRAAELVGFDLEVRVNTVREMVRAARLERGLTQREAARLLRIHQPALSNIERGIASLPPKYFDAVTRAFCIPRARLIEAHMSEYRAKLMKRMR